MATLPLAKSPGVKIEVGDKVLCGVDVVDTTPIMNRVEAFRAVHQSYSAAELAVRAAARAVQEQRLVIASAVVDLNRALEALAIALPNDGFDRKQPFRAFGALSPSALRNLSFAEEAAHVIVLERAIAKHSGISAKTAHVAESAGNAARVLQGKLEPLVDLENARSAAIAKRDAYAPAWEKAFQRLKLAAKFAEEDGSSGLFAALFERPAAKKKSALDPRRTAVAKSDVAPASIPASQ